jgi:hypothetical protein
MEIDSQMFYSSAPWDMKARHYVAETMNKASTRQQGEWAAQADALQQHHD